LLLALRRLVDDDPNLSDRIQLVVAGRSEFDERRLVDEVRLGGVVRQLGHLPREQSLALQRAAHTLILLTSDARSEATGKLYEYLAAKRPIIALADGNEAARIVSSTATGQVVPPNDVAAIADAIRAALAGDLERAYAPHGLEPYTYPAPAEQMAKAVETAIERRRSRMGS
jgi:glycosyltransferase involved in cell wall biosynthesis